MVVTRLNHAVLYVRSVAATREFYENVLGFRVVMEWPGRAAFFQANGSTNDHDLGVFQIGADAEPSAAGRSSVGLYHLAWEVDTLASLRTIGQRLAERGALSGASDHATTKALYAHDPDGLEFEVSWMVPAEHITPELLERRVRVLPLDLDAEIDRYGADTPGGIGVSHSAPYTRSDR